MSVAEESVLRISTTFETVVKVAEQKSAFIARSVDRALIMNTPGKVAFVRREEDGRHVVVETLDVKEFVVGAFSEKNDCFILADCERYYWVPYGRMSRSPNRYPLPDGLWRKVVGVACTIDKCVLVTEGTIVLQEMEPQVWIEISCPRAWVADCPKVEVVFPF